MTDGVLLVASPGGHVDELVDFATRIPADYGPQVWVTERTAQTQALLAGRAVEFVPGVGARQGFRAAGTLPRAFRLLRKHRPRYVLSTGAALSVPFLVAARVLGIETHYIDSATRLTNPSVTGRIAQRLPGVRLRHQGTQWSSTKWQAISGVFDGYAADDALASVPESQTSQEQPVHVVVTLGSERFSFARAVEGIASSLAADTVVLWQVGHTPVPADLIGSIHQWVPSDELSRAVSEADVVITHAGVGSILNALRAGVAPVVIPRRATFQEHVDDHQVELALELHERGIVVMAEPTDVGSAIALTKRKRVTRVATTDLPSPL